MKKIIALILILAALVAGYIGIDKLDSSESGLKIGDLELKAEDTSSKKTAYMYIGGALICLVAGVTLVSRKDK
ncbi:hypothetical protein [Sinomicrobium weinanense]|uniref:DUF3185 family protein n=1 Tax=Sinomicrobium weinanense TaxID=2842200 RepID=A0A926JVE2_9FLAO|nr:hypothetical protein [Sinomicrobium weinanense]MBC9797907.1 hypothetical protein [Sinomicrobium weinanense]MBU3125444.1 hypothetical protein [Sinomicrobium weinanense]